MKIYHFVVLFLVLVNALCATGQIVDPRYPVNDSRIGRLVQLIPYKGGIISDVCTATLIGPSTLISAGHCFKRGTGKMRLEIQVPLSNADVSINSSSPEHTFQLDVSSLRFSEVDSRYPELDRGGGDWAVFKVLPNEITQKLPGDLWGYYKVSLDAPKVGDSIRMRGYGRSTPIPERNNTLQEGVGHVASVFLQDPFPQLAYQDLYATGGNSGSSVVLAQTEEIIGIHFSNGLATAIFSNPQFQKAIRECLNTMK